MRRLLLLAAAVGTLAGAVAWGAPPPVGGVALFRAGDAGPVEIARGTVRLRLERTADRWWVTGSDGARRLADRAGAEALLARVSALHVERPLASFARPLPGAFDHPLVITRGGQTARIGAPSRIPGLVYARLPDGGLYLMRPVALDPGALSLVDRRLFPDGLGPVSEVDVNGPDLLLHASREFGPWRLTAPMPSAADGDRIDTWLARLPTLRGDPAAEPLAPGTGYQIVLTRMGGGTLSMVLTRDGRAELDGTPLVLDGPPDGLVPDHFDWLRKEVIRVLETGLTGIQVQQGEDTVVLARHGEEPWAEKTTGKVFRSWVATLFADVNPLPAIGLKEGGADLLGATQLEVRFWRDAQVAATIELWRDEDGRWWARGGDAVTVFEIADDLPGHLARLF